MQVVDVDHDAVGGRSHLEPLRGQRRSVMIEGFFPLRLDDGAHLGKRPTRVEDVAGDGEPFAAAHVRVELDHPAGEPQRFLAQIDGCERVILQHAHHVARLQHRPDAESHRLAPVGDDHVDHQPQAARHVLEQLAQLQRLTHRAHLGRRSKGDVEHEVRRARCHFL